MKLYRIPVEFEIVVCAETEREALSIACQSVSEEGSNLSVGDLGFPALIKTEEDIPRGWKGSYPYGDCADEKIEIILARITEE